MSACHLFNGIFVQLDICSKIVEDQNIEQLRDFQNSYMKNEDKMPKYALTYLASKKYYHFTLTFSTLLLFPNQSVLPQEW